MLAQIIRYATSHPKRVIAVWLVLGLGLSVLGGLKAYSVTTDDTAQFLPKRSESAQGIKYAQRAFGVQKGTSSLTRAAQARRRASSRSPPPTSTRSPPAMRRWRPDTEALKTDEAIDVAAARRRRGRRRRPGRRSATAGSSRCSGRRTRPTPSRRSAYRQFRDRVVDQARDARACRPASPAGSPRWPTSPRRPRSARSSRRSCCSPPSSGSACCSSAGRWRPCIPLLAIVVIGGAATGLIVAVRARVRLQARLRHAAADHGRARRHRHRLLHVPAVPGA